MRRGLLPILACLAAAGCLSPAATDAIGSASLPALDFLAALAMDQPTGGAEPNLAIAPDGTLWITAVAGSQERPNAMTGAAWLWRSTDGGATWETMRAPVRDTPLGTNPTIPSPLGNVGQTRRPFGSSDADVVASPDGWVYYSDWWNWGTPVIVPGGGLLPASPNSRYGSYLVERSSDGGVTWESSPVTTLDTIGGIDRQWLVAGEDGYVGLAYAYFHGPQNTVRALGDPQGRSDFIMTIQIVESHDYGASWSDPTTVVPAMSGRSLQIAHPRMHPEGAVVMPFGDMGMGSDGWKDASSVWLAVRPTPEDGWAQRKVADVPEGFDNLWAVQGAVDLDGTVHVAWASRTGENMTISVASSEDLGTTWGPIRQIRAAGLNFLPWVASAGTDTVAVAWYGSDATGDPMKAANETEWWPYVAESLDSGATWSIARASSEPVKLGPMCPRGAACASDRELLDYPSLDYDADGRLHVAFASSRDVAGAKAGLVQYAGAAFS